MKYDTFFFDSAQLVLLVISPANRKYGPGLAPLTAAATKPDRSSVQFVSATGCCCEYEYWIYRGRGSGLLSPAICAAAWPRN